MMMHSGSPARWLLALMFAVLVPMANAGQLYKSVGPDGRTVYSDHPPADGQSAQKIEYKDQPTSSLGERDNSYEAQLQRLRASAPKIAEAPSGTVLYMAQWCGYCKKAKAYLAARSIPYTAYDIDTKEGLASYASTGHSKGGIPFLMRGSATLRGFSADAYDRFFSRTQ